jgi:D-alanyl-lipoteichoic acid acyltransferase DltB (MBOAT superfamily)
MIAIARLCGVTTLPENFDRPYLARNLLDFWGRWHISFGIWIRHYVFTPLSKNLLTATPPRLQEAALIACVIVTFLIIGAWHGTTLNFLVFGLMHGIGIVVTGIYGWVLKNALAREARKRWEQHRVVHALSVILCFHYVAATILLFPNSVQDVVNVLRDFF